MGKLCHRGFFPFFWRHPLKPIFLVFLSLNIALLMFAVRVTWQKTLRQDVTYLAHSFSFNTLGTTPFHSMSETKNTGTPARNVLASWVNTSSSGENYNLTNFTIFSLKTVAPPVDIQYQTTRAPIVIGLSSTADLSVFKSQMTPEERQIFLDLIDAFNAAMKNANISYFLYGGSLVGSWRHHGMVPWDDDMDVGMLYDDQQAVIAALKTLAPNFEYKFRPKYAIKFFSRNSRNVAPWPWKWPFIDVSFVLQNDTHIIESDKNFPEYKYPKEEVFPLRKRPYEGRMLPVPGQTEKFLTRTYDLDKCLVGHYSHRIEKSRTEKEKGSVVKCRELKKQFPFVERVKTTFGGCNETLVDNGRVVSWYYDPAVLC